MRHDDEDMIAPTGTGRAASRDGRGTNQAYGDAGYTRYLRPCPSQGPAQGLRHAVGYVPHVVRASVVPCAHGVTREGWAGARCAGRRSGAARWLLVAAALALVAALVVVVVLAMRHAGGQARQGEAPAITSSATGRGSAGQDVDDRDMPSTPMSQWQRGVMPYLYQKDPAWRNEPYAGGNVGDNGCGPTCLTMVYVYLTGNTDYTPASMCALSEAGGFVDSGMTAWTFMTQGAAQVGLVGEELPAMASTVTDLLASGVPIICSMGPGDFTKLGHFIVLAGVDESGRVLVRDPNSPERSQQSWDVDTILSQCRNLWSFSLA